MGKLIMVSFSNADQGPVRFKVDSETELSLITYQDLQQYLEVALDIGTESYRIEVLDSKLGVYHKVDPSSAQRLCIQGRLFDSSKGLPIGNKGYTLSIKEREQAALGTGLNTWDGSVILAKYLEVHSHLIVHKNVLELGAGTGVAGIAAGLLGAQSVTLTDLDYTVENLQTNAQHNFHQLQQPQHPPLNHQLQEGENMPPSSFTYEVSKLDWADTSTYPRDPLNGGLRQYDIILGADVVWLEHLVPLLVKALAALVTDNTLLLLSHQTRSERTDKLLFDSLAQHFEMTKVPPSAFHPDFQSSKINIFEGRRRQVLKDE